MADLTEAWCRKRMADLDGAIRCMEQLLERNPRSAIGHFNLGCYVAIDGDRERALDEVTLACGLDPTFREMLLEELTSIRCIVTRASASCCCASGVMQKYAAFSAAANAARGVGSSSTYQPICLRRPALRATPTPRG